MPWPWPCLFPFSPFSLFPFFRFLHFPFFHTCVISPEFHIDIRGRFGAISAMEWYTCHCNNHRPNHYTLHEMQSETLTLTWPSTQGSHKLERTFRLSNLLPPSTFLHFDLIIHLALKIVDKIAYWQVMSWIDGCFIGMDCLLICVGAR